MLEHVKYLSLQLDLKPEDRFLWQSSTSWMMWNLLVSGLLVGSTIVLYDGSPTYRHDRLPLEGGRRPRRDGVRRGRRLLAGVRQGGAAPGQGLSRSTRCARSGRRVRRCPPSGFRWIQEGIGRPVPVISMSGGTDVVTAFIGGCPLVPIRAGELNVICLGVAAEAWGDGGTPGHRGGR